MEPELVWEEDEDGKPDYSVKPTCSICCQIPWSMGGICTHFEIDPQEGSCATS